MHTTRTPLVTRLVLGTLAAATLTLGVGATAGATTKTTTKTTTTASLCSKAPAALARITKAEAHITAGLPKLTAAEQKAIASGHKRLAARLIRRIDRLESNKTVAALQRASLLIRSRCHLPS